jgi:hypothetical protein
MIRRLTDSEVIERTQQDAKVLAALDDAIAAIFIHGAEQVSLEHLKSVIEGRLAVHADAVLEAEGLDGECA